MVTNWDTLGTGTPEDQTVAAEAIVGMLNEGKEADERIVDRIVPDADGQRVTFFYPDGTSRNISLVDEEGNRLSRSQWLSEGTEFHGVEGDYGRFYEGGIVPAGSTVLDRGERTVGYEEPAVGYDDAIEVGIEGVLKKSSPRAQYELRTQGVGQDDKGQDQVAAAAVDALARMNFSGVDVEIIEDIDRPGFQFSFDTKQNLIKYFIPDVMPYQVFIPDTNAAGIVGQLIEMADIARSENREITVEELRSILGPENYKNYNTQAMRNTYPAAAAPVQQPADNTQEEDSSTSTTPDYSNL
jgi:hypothetical protein